jgi:p-cumate 2,3-dioxygenase subunit beta
VSAAAEGIGAPVEYGSPELVREVESFLAYESELLDDWRLEEWLELFTPDATYVVPTTDCPTGDPAEDLFFVRDDYFLLSQRVAALLDGTAWTENPHSTTHRMVSNVRARETGEGEVEVKANLLVHWARGDRLHAYPVHLTLQLVRGGRAGFEIRHRTSVLALEQLRPHGRVSLIL